MSKAKSKKAKGNRFESWIVQDLRTSLDAQAMRTPGSGSGLDKNDIICPNLGIEIEAKNASQFHLKSDLEQLERQQTPYNSAYLVIRDPNLPETAFNQCLVVMRWGQFKDLLKGQNKSLEIEPKLNYEQRSAIQSLKSSIERVKKLFLHE